MNNDEIEFINKNSTDLITNTKCTVMLVAKLQNHKILNDEEAEILKNDQKSQLERSSYLYDTLKTKTGAFQILKQVLKENFQSGAVDILERIAPSQPELPSSPTPLFQPQRELTENQIRQIATILSNSGTVWSSWTQVLAKLDVKNYDVYMSSLRSWQTSNPNDATLENFVGSLKAAGLNNTAELILAKLQT